MRDDVATAVERGPGAASGASFPQVDVLGVGVSAIRMVDALHAIHGWIARRERQYVCVTGVHGVMESQRDESLRRIHNAAGLGPDLLLACCERSVSKGYRHFFYAGAPGVPEQLAQRLSARFSGLEVVGTYLPPFRPLRVAEHAALVRRINAARPDIVWVGLSTPKQEQWMAEHVGRLEAAVLIGVGAAFDFHAGVKRQAPRWMQRSGLEWLFRMVSERARLAPQYVLNNPLFVWRIVQQQLNAQWPTRSSAEQR